MAERLQHVEAPMGETCVICHNPEPIGPVCLSCQHLFCCGCAYLTFARREDCPLCFQKPLPMKLYTQIPSHSNDIDTRLRKIYTYYLLQLPLLVSSNILSGYLDDAERTPGIQAMLSVQHVFFALLSLALVAAFLVRKIVAWNTRWGVDV